MVAAVQLTAFAVSVAGTTPYLPSVRYEVIAGAVALAAAAGTLVPGGVRDGRAG
ncbi:hypothetical protein ACIBRY_13670 [Streptomyces anulatus]